MHVILLPGLDGTGILFEPLLAVLSEKLDVQVITYSNKKEENYTQLTEYVREKLPIGENFVLVAESFSGPIGYEIAANPPANLKSVIFVATFINVPNKLLWFIGKLPLSRALQIYIPEFLIKQYMLGKEIERSIIELFRTSLNTVSSSVLAFRIREMLKLSGSSKTIKIPCAYISSSNDKLVSRIHINEFMKAAPNIEVREINGPHFILQAKPNECAKIIEEYAAL
ncbi:MAG: alpha/beta hydrolase [Gammaproteobacteria bacterium]|nr:alpha/beta hydrolase [Gammaproteobacteria bacterium]